MANGFVSATADTFEPSSFESTDVLLSPNLPETQLSLCDLSAGTPANNPVQNTDSGTGFLAEINKVLAPIEKLGEVGVGLAAQAGAFGSSAQRSAIQQKSPGPGYAYDPRIGKYVNSQTGKTYDPQTGKTSTPISLTTIVLIVGAVALLIVLVVVFLKPKPG